jgi:hypothetical protein
MVGINNVHNPPWPRCECGHRRGPHVYGGKVGQCMWRRPNKETGKMEWCDCKEYWVLSEHLAKETTNVVEYSAIRGS